MATFTWPLGLEEELDEALSDSSLWDLGSPSSDSSELIDPACTPPVAQSGSRGRPSADQVGPIRSAPRARAAAAKPRMSACLPPAFHKAPAKHRQRLPKTLSEDAKTEIRCAY